MGDEFAMEGMLHLDHPLTEEQFDSLIDVDFDDTPEVWFHTKHGKEVHFVKKQEPVIPKEERLNDVDSIYRCGNCGVCFYLPRQKYCAICGKAVKWDNDDINVS